MSSSGGLSRTWTSRPARATAVRDIRERHAIQERLARQAFYDRLIVAAESRAVPRPGRPRARWARPGDAAPVAVLLLDLDRFKVVNESLGHAVGDQIIAAVGRRFGEAIRPGDTLARLGGDEFAVLLDGITDEVGARLIAERLVDTLAEPFPVDGRDITVGVSVGVAVATAGRSGAADLLRDAEIALYRAKAEPGGPRRRLRVEHGRRVDGTPGAGQRPPPGGRAGRAAAPLPAARRPANRSRRRPRGAGPLGAPDARPAGPRRVHPARRGDGPDPGDRRVGARGSVPPDASVAARAAVGAAPHGGRQPLRSPVHAAGPAPRPSPAVLVESGLPASSLELEITETWR